MVAPVRKRKDPAGDAERDLLSENLR